MVRVRKSRFAVHRAPVGRVSGSRGYFFLRLSSASVDARRAVSRGSRSGGQADRLGLLCCRSWSRSRGVGIEMRLFSSWSVETRHSVIRTFVHSPLTASQQFAARVGWDAACTLPLGRSCTCWGETHFLDYIVSVQGGRSSAADQSYLMQELQK